jgi:hypothetical protein
MAGFCIGVLVGLMLSFTIEFLKFVEEPKLEEGEACSL